MIRKKEKKRARVLIVDDHPAVREALGLRISRQPDLEVCGEADNTREALARVAASRPDVVVVDIALKASNGIDLIKRIRDRNHHVPILVWSMHSESLYAERALRAGALGYVNKDQATDTIVDAIHRVLAGKVWLSEAVADKVLQRSVGRTRKSRASVEDLADREMEVFRLIGGGVKTADIAGQLHLSIKTIETYRERIRKKLRLNTGTQLAHYATVWMLENQ